MQVHNSNSEQELNVSSIANLKISDITSPVNSRSDQRPLAKTGVVQQKFHWPNDIVIFLTTSINEIFLS